MTTPKAVLRTGRHGCSHGCPECHLGGVAIACRLCGTELVDGTTQEAWLEVELDGGWIAAYRLMAQEGRPVVGEVRVFPNESAPREQGRWSAERLGDQAPVPFGGVPARVLRQLRVREHLSLIDDVVEQHQEQSFRLELLDHGFTQVAMEAGRRGRSDLFYAEIASAYVRLLGEHAPINQLRRQLQDLEGLHFAEATIRDFVNQARHRGLLTSSPPGRPGGELTSKAREILGRRQSDRHEHDKSRTRVRIKNPADGSIGESTQRGFEKVWQPKGWTKATDAVGDPEEER